MRDATKQSADCSAQHEPPLATLHVAGTDILYVHLPSEADATELLRSRLRALDQGRTQFRRRVRKQPKPKPVERFMPIVSDRVVDAHEEV